jgi:S-methylmethionine-dependent homocysteine/selenocysteine methylase
MPPTSSLPGLPALKARLRDPRPLVLDGATGTELERRGAPVSLPLWSAHALIHAKDLVAEIHAEYAAAGADLLTANTFRTHRRSLARGGLADRAAEFTQRAVTLAREAARPFASDRPIWILGSAAPLEDCYRPDLVPSPTELQREHAQHAEHLANSGVDAILVETMNNGREAIAALSAARFVGVPALVSFVCWDGDRLLSGEPLCEALDAVAREHPLGVLVNCLPPSNVAACLPPLRASEMPFGVYPNLGTPDEPMGQVRREECSPSEFADIAAGWRDCGARLLGGCCGTQPAHIRSLVQRLRS